MFRTLYRFIFRVFSILNYTYFLHQWYNFALVKIVKTELYELSYTLVKMIERE